MAHGDPGADGGSGSRWRSAMTIDSSRRTELSGASPVLVMVWLPGLSLREFTGRRSTAVPAETIGHYRQPGRPTRENASAGALVVSLCRRPRVACADRIG